MKRFLYSFLVLVVLLAGALTSVADHCHRCSASQNCRPAASGGKPFCDDSGSVCVLQGLTCTTTHPLEDEPLATEYTVAAVERLDEPQSAPSETRVASIEAPQPANR